MRFLEFYQMVKGISSFTKGVAGGFLLSCSLTVRVESVQADFKIEAVKPVISQDQDQDGLSDFDEEVYGTNLLLPDSDQDGLDDFMELRLGTEPLIPDTDNDGLTDGDEYLRVGSDALLPDTDRDGLSDFFEDAIGSNPNLADTDQDGVADGVEFYSDMDLFDPDTPMLGGGQDDDSDRLTNGIEQHITNTDPLKADTDDDGLDDGSEVTLPQITDPLSPDTDTDGLSDGVELQLGTDPNDADTDRDGLFDGDEVRLGTDPNIADSDGDGIIDGFDSTPVDARLQ